MTDGEREKIKAWVGNWKVAGEELDRLKWEELRAMDELASARIFNHLTAGLPGEWEPPERECGLVPQQAFFSKAHADQRRR